MQKEINSRLHEDNLIIDWRIELDFKNTLFIHFLLFWSNQKHEKKLQRYLLGDQSV